MKSVYLCGKRLMDEADIEVGRTKPLAGRGELQAELTYLLAQQFIDGSALLKRFAKSESADSDETPIFSMPLCWNVHLFLKPVNHDIRGVAESLTLQIDRLLKQYKEKV